MAVRLASSYSWPLLLPNCVRFDLCEGRLVRELARRGSAFSRAEVPRIDLAHAGRARLSLEPPSSQVRTGRGDR